MTPWELRNLQIPAPNPFNAKEIDCPMCSAKIGQQCFGGTGNHVKRARAARWIKMGVIAEVAQD